MKKQYKQQAGYFLLFWILLVSAYPGSAQFTSSLYASEHSANGFSIAGDIPSISANDYRFRGIRRVDIKHASPVTVVGSAQIEQEFSTPDIREIIRYTPGTHVQTSRTSVINIRGVNGNAYTRNDFILLNDKRPIYARSYIVGTDQVPLAAIEQLEVLRGPSNVLYGKGAVSGVVEFKTKTELDERLTSALYDPYYDIPVPNYDNFQNTVEKEYQAALQTFFRSGETTSTTSDNTFGTGGRLNVNVFKNSDFFVENSQYFDANGNLRKVTDKEIYPEGYFSFADTSYDCDLQPLAVQTGFGDQYGYEYNLANLVYENGKPQYGYRELAPSIDPSFRLPLLINSPPQPGSFSYGLTSDFNNKALAQILAGNIDKWKEKAAGYNCADKDDDDFYASDVITVGLSYRSEDFGGDRQAFYGPNASFTHFFSPTIGATADVGFTFRSESNWKINVLNAFAGPTIVPFKGAAGLDDKFTFSAHALAGYNSVTSKFSGFSNTSGNFSAKVGVSGDLNLNDRLGIRLSASDIMVFPKGGGNTTNNYLVTASLRWDLNHSKK